MSIVTRVLVPLLLALGVASPAYAVRVAVDFSDPDNPQMKTLSGYCDRNGDQCDQTRKLPWLVDFGDGATNEMVVHGSGLVVFAGEKLPPQFATEQFQFSTLAYLEAGLNLNELFYNGETVWEQAARVKYDGDAVIVTWFTCFTPKSCFNLPYSARMAPGMTNGVSELQVTIDYTGLPSNFFGFSDKVPFAELTRVGTVGNPTSVNPHPGTLFLRLPATFIDVVPEPSAWAMMIMGFGGIGAALRRRRTPIAAPTA